MDAKQTRQPCKYCEKPSANEEDWATIPDGERDDLCWGPGGNCDVEAEDALDRVIRERDEARVEAARLEAELRWYTEVD